MQLDKSTKKIEQIEKVASSNDQIAQSITDIIDKFNVKSNLNDIDLVKRCGILASTITTALIILPFLGASNILALFKSGLNKEAAGQKDVYYDLKNNPKINWRTILLLIAKQFQHLTNEISEESEDVKEEVRRIKATIFDDSAIGKSGKKIEGVGFIHDHVTNLHILGFKLLVCGFWDGVSFIPIDFSLHREKRDAALKKIEHRLEQVTNKISQIENCAIEIKEVRKTKLKLQKEAVIIYKSNPTKTNGKSLERKKRAIEKIDIRLLKIKKELSNYKTSKQFVENEYYEVKTNHRLCGLTKKEIKNQFKKQRDRNTAGYKRKNETGENKIDIMIKMLKRTVSKGFIPDYVLTDSWFFSYKVLHAINSIGKNIKMVSMAKIGNAKFTILPYEKVLNPHEMITLYDRTKGKESRKYKARYIQLKANYQGIRVNLFLIKFGTYGTWRMLVTTDLNLCFSKIIEVYKIRWSIEVFFKECKQHLLLGKSQSLDFDAQIADVTLALIRYVLLSYYERIHYGTTIGGLFKQLSQSAIEENILADINIYFSELLKIFADLAGIDFFPFYENLLRNDKAEEIILRLGIKPAKPDLVNVA
ncbi:MAG: transposase [Salinivirgaceae bacterium]|jgi:hypothetical protein|nr:transposase [Salinivirgaceae bacterium]